MLVVFLLVVLLVFAPGNSNNPVNLVFMPGDDYSSQQCFFNVGVEALSNLGGEWDRCFSGLIEDSIGMKDFVTNFSIHQNLILGCHESGPRLQLCGGIRIVVVGCENRNR